MEVFLKFLLAIIGLLVSSVLIYFVLYSRKWSQLEQTVEPILDKPVEQRTPEEIALLNKFNNKENFIERYKRRIIYAMVGGIVTVITTYNVVVGDITNAPYEGAFLYGLLMGGIANMASSIAVPTPLIKTEN